MERLTREQLEHLTVSRFEHRHRYLCAAAFSRGHVLDIACGVGYGANILLANPAVAEYVGVDNEQEAIAEARIAPPPKARFVKASALDLPFPNKAFDTIVSLETLEHLSDPAQACQEFRRVLRTDGILIGSVPSAKFEEFCAHQYGPNPFHLQIFSQERLSALLEEFFPCSKLFMARVGLAAGLYEASGMPDLYYDRVVVETTNAGRLYGSYFFVASMRPQAFLAEPAGVLSIGESYFEVERLRTDRLLAAAVSEERIAQIIRDKDQLVHERDKRIETTDQRVQTMDELLRRADELLRTKDQAIMECEVLLREKDERLGEVGRLVAAKDARITGAEEIAQLMEKRLAACLAGNREAEATLQTMKSELQSVEDALESTKNHLEATKSELVRIRDSRAWRLLCRLNLSRAVKAV